MQALPQTLMLSSDHKCSVPLGKPDLPQSTGVRAQNRSHGLAGTSNVSLDHDFHVAGVVPSVCVLVDIPGNSRASFHDGNIDVACRSPDDVNSGYPVQLENTGGSPDYNTTFWTVKTAHVMKLTMLDLLVGARTAPSHNYVSMAERSMSLLNLSLQNSAFARSARPHAYEKKMKSLS